MRGRTIGVKQEIVSHDAEMHLDAVFGFALVCQTIPKFCRHPPKKHFFQPHRQNNVVQIVHKCNLIQSLQLIIHEK
jgi:hypothetical protein